MKSGKVRELLDEFRTVFAGRSNILDSILPPLLFLIINFGRISERQGTPVGKAAPGFLDSWPERRHRCSSRP